MDIQGKLLEAAARVFAETGYRGATTRRIAHEAGVNEVTLFRHFGSKGELMLAAMHHFGAAVPVVVLPEVPEDPERELTAWAVVHLRHLTEAHSLIRVAMGESEEHEDLAACGSSHPRRAGEQLREYVGRLQSEGLASADFEAGVASAMLMGTLFSDAMGRDLMPELFPLSLEASAEAYVGLFLRAIGVSASDGGAIAGQSS